MSSQPTLSRRARRDRLPRTSWLRIAVPAALILVWLTLAGLGGPLFGKVDEVSSNDPAAYLPTSAEATKVQDLQGEFSDAEGIPAIVVFVGEQALSESELDQIGSAMAAVAEIPGVEGEVSPPIGSQDGLAAQAFVPIDPEAGIAEVLAEIEDVLGEQAPASVTVFVTGPAGFTADLASAFAGIDGLLLGVALGAVLLILLLVYRSFLLPLVVLSTSMFALCVALLVVWWLAKWDVLLLSGQTQGILFILVIGAATDYSLLLVARFREELRSEADKGIATRRALRGSVEPILASGGTVIAGLMCLVLSDLKSNSALGPVASIGILFAMLAALSFLPAVLFALGRSAFWPRRPVFEPGYVPGAQPRGIWARVASTVERRPRKIWLGTALVLVAGTLGIVQLDASGVPRSELVLGSSAARDGLVALGEHFPGGSGSPALVVVAEGSLQDAADVALAHPGVASVSVLAADSP
ncbi:MAG: MMPL family transporter, partial [Actinomycetota bacterium]|nr:MMPL family transporter [Actinomycetota bacterium]